MCCWLTVEPSKKVEKSSLKRIVLLKVLWVLHMIKRQYLCRSFCRIYDSGKDRFEFDYSFFLSTGDSLGFVKEFY